jgi:peptidylprolyl isomerase
MTGDGKIFSNSLEKGTPYDIRVGTGQVVAGLDEGLKTMRAGGIRRVYVPGNLSFPKGLPSGPGRPRVPPASPVIFDVQLLYIPGLDMEDE